MENSLLSVRAPDLNNQSVNAVTQECVGNITIGIVEGEVSTDVSQGNSIGGQDMQGAVSPMMNQHSQCQCDTNEEYWKMKLEKLRNSNDELAQSLATIEREYEIRVTLLNSEIEQLKEEILAKTSAIKRLQRNSSHFETEVAEMEENYNLQMRENNREVDVMKQRNIDLTKRNETVRKELKDTKELYSEEKQRHKGPDHKATSLQNLKKQTVRCRSVSLSVQIGYFNKKRKLRTSMRESHNLDLRRRHLLKKLV
ncbi:hypothetical protein HHI36_017428 [Cryptolaemus montrouzieri]|uniref:Uncharacterized protein n=1 Tax=Cryptolaemus montrouzieri TaxID=559131 RepID=A0ABD2NME2_9CUCU